MDRAGIPLPHQLIDERMPQNPFSKVAPVSSIASIRRNRESALWGVLRRLSVRREILSIGEPIVPKETREDPCTTT